MRVYLAGRFSRREELLRWADALRSLGHSVNARWLTDPFHRLEVDDLPMNTQAFNRELAFHDLQDIQSCDTLLYSGPAGTRGGCHVEFGIAIALGKRLIWIGPPTHVFSWLPQVERFSDFEGCLDLFTFGIK